MKKLIICLTIFVMLSGCTTNEKLTWFNNKDEAIQFGIEEEGIEQEDIIAELESGEEQFIVYKKEENDEMLIGLSNIAKSKQKYAWYRSDAYIKVQDDVQVILKTKAFSGNEYNFYVGMSEDRERTGLKDALIDEKTGIYYYIESIK